MSHLLDQLPFIRADKATDISCNWEPGHVKLPWKKSERPAAFQLCMEKIEKEWRPETRYRANVAINIHVCMLICYRNWYSHWIHCNAAGTVYIAVNIRTCQTVHSRTLLHPIRQHVSSLSTHSRTRVNTIVILHIMPHTHKKPGTTIVTYKHRQQNALLHRGSSFVSIYLDSGVCWTVKHAFFCHLFSFANMFVLLRFFGPIWKLCACVYWVYCSRGRYSG